MRNVCFKPAFVPKQKATSEKIEKKSPQGGGGDMP